VSHTKQARGEPR